MDTDATGRPVPYAYVLRKSCGCIEFACTAEAVEWYGLRLNVAVLGVTLKEYNRLKLLCDSCNRKDVPK